MADVKKTSLNLDPTVVADAKIAIVEAEHLGIEAPRNLSSMVNAAVATLTRELRVKIEHAKHSRTDRAKPRTSRRG